MFFFCDTLFAADLYTHGGPAGKRAALTVQVLGDMFQVMCGITPLHSVDFQLVILLLIFMFAADLI